MLKSNLPYSSENIFLAQELLKLSPGEDSRLVELQVSITETLKTLEVPIESRPGIEINHITDKHRQFPFVNPDIERLPHYHKNKDWQETEIHRSLLSRAWVVNYENLRHMVLGNFCIEPTSDSEYNSWELKRLLLLPCSHKYDRYVFVCRLK